MKLEENRSQKLLETNQARILRMEEAVAKMRARLALERERLAKHEIALGRKEAAGKEAGCTQERVDKKGKEILALEGRLEEMSAMITVYRQEMERILTFNPIQTQLDRLPKNFRRAVKGEWQRTPNSGFKTYEDIFTPPGAKIIPVASRRLTLAEYDKLPLQPCPVDPALIPDWFADEFGLGNFEGVSAFEKLEQKTELIPQVADLFEHLQPLQAYGNTTYRVQSVQGYAPEHDGKILISYYLGHTDDREADRKVMQVYDSAYKAERHAVEVDLQYKGERKKIADSRDRVDQINKDLRGKRKNDPGMEDVKKRLLVELKALENVRNHSKVQTREILRAIKEIKDALGRPNPGAACARMVRALNFLQTRQAEIFEKDENVTSDGHIMEVTIEQSKEVLDSARRGVYALGGMLEDGKLHRANEFHRVLGQLPDLDKLKLRPFSLYAERLKADVVAMKQGVSMKNRDSIRGKARDACGVCKIFEIQHECEQILNDIVKSPMGVSGDQLLARAVHLRDLAREKPSFLQADQGIGRAYDDMTQNLDKLIQALTDAKTDPEKQERSESLRKFLDELNFTELLENL